MKNTAKRKTNLTQKLGIGKGGFKKAIRDGLLLSSNDKDAYECGIKFFNNRCAYCGMSGDVIQLTADRFDPPILENICLMFQLSHDCSFLRQPS